MRKKITFGILLAAGILTSNHGMGPRSAAAAEPGAATDDSVEDQINQGIALRRAGKDEAALGVFLDVEKRSPDSVRVMLHIATAALAAGKWTMASDYMQKAQLHKDDAYFQKHKSAIDNVQRVINQHVGLFRANGAPAGAEVRLSGELIGTLPMGNAKAVEVGSYMLEVSKSGYFPLRRLINVANDGTLTQEDVELREQKPVPSAAIMGQTSLQAGAAAGDAETQAPVPWWRERWVTWSLLGVGVAAGAVSGTAFAIRENDANRWNSDACLSTLVPSASRGSLCASTHRDIETLQAVGITTGIAAGVFGAAALIHGLATAPRSTQERSPAPQAERSCIPSLGGVVCYGSF
ncbi:MAG TPA: PEGA domain-containing protein [Polyangiaceae bacterium]|jgi:hypothetical protein